MRNFDATSKYIKLRKASQKLAARTQMRFCVRAILSAVKIYTRLAERSRILPFKFFYLRNTSEAAT